MGLIVISPCVTHGRMLQEDEEVHQMSSDNNQKTETRYVVAVLLIRALGRALHCVSLRGTSDFQ